MLLSKSPLPTLECAEALMNKREDLRRAHDLLPLSGARQESQKTDHTPKERVRRFYSAPIRSVMSSDMDMDSLRYILCGERKECPNCDERHRYRGEAEWTTDAEHDS